MAYKNTGHQPTGTLEPDRVQLVKVNFFNSGPAAVHATNGANECSVVMLQPSALSDHCDRRGVSAPGPLQAVWHNCLKGLISQSHYTTPYRSLENSLACSSLSQAFWVHAYPSGWKERQAGTAGHYRQAGYKPHSGRSTQPTRAVVHDTRRLRLEL